MKLCKTDKSELAEIKSMYDVYKIFGIDFDKVEKKYRNVKYFFWNPGMNGFIEDTISQNLMTDKRFKIYALNKVVAKRYKNDGIAIGRDKDAFGKYYRIKGREYQIAKSVALDMLGWAPCNDEKVEMFAVEFRPEIGDE